MADQSLPVSGTALPPGTKAPEFKLSATPDQTLSLAEMRGHPVILAFYPADWSPVCGDEVSLLNEVLPEFHRLGAQLVAHGTLDGLEDRIGLAAIGALVIAILHKRHDGGSIAEHVIIGGQGGNRAGHAAAPSARGASFSSASRMPSAPGLMPRGDT